MSDPKNAHYKELLVRMNAAYSAQYYLEAIWYAYSILEDRCVSALRQSGGERYANGQPIKTLGKKLSILKERRPNDPLLKAYFSDALMDRLKKWKDERDGLMHAMADAVIPLSEVDKKKFIIAEQASGLVRDTCAAARRLKANRNKA